MGQTPRRAQDYIRSLDPVLSCFLVFWFFLFPCFLCGVLRHIISFSMLVFLSISWSGEGAKGTVGVLEVLVEYSAGGQKP